MKLLFFAGERLLTVEVTLLLILQKTWLYSVKPISLGYKSLTSNLSLVERFSFL